MKALLLFMILSGVVACQSENPKVQTGNGIDVLVLGIAQDAGYPQIGCKKACCTAVWKREELPKSPVSLGLIDHSQQSQWLFEATPAIINQWQMLTSHSAIDSLSGIFITHAHMGHYTGLMELGREAMSSNNMPVYAMPRLQQFLTDNGPWNQLIKLKNIKVKSLNDKEQVSISKNIKVTPILVPHRDEFSETIGFLISSPQKKLLFIPDIDKWEKWTESVEQVIAQVDYALIDGTFFDGEELPGRNMAEIPHPFVSESLTRFASLAGSEKDKIYFIHFNHTNPLNRSKSIERKQVEQLGFHVAEQGLVFHLN